MPEYIHSVSLDVTKCKGCTNCLKHCPTEAIRIRNGHAVINSQLCIDCGECIRKCPYKAKKAIYDKLPEIEGYKWKIALPAPALYGQFDNIDDIDYILTAILQCGFDDVYEVARGAELVSAYTRYYLNKKNAQKPLISSACPVVARLISVRFPYLCDNLCPILPPIEISAKMAKEEALKKHPELSPEDIGVFFISPCPAKVSYVKNPIGIEKSAVTAVLSISELYFNILNKLGKIEKPLPLSKVGIVGVSWAGSGGEASSLFNDRYLAADGIDNVINVLDELENGKLSNVDFIELNACSGGCVGGTLTVENPFIAKARLQNLRRYLPVVQNKPDIPSNENDENGGVPDNFLWSDSLSYSPVSQLDTDRGEALRKMNEIEAIMECLPHLDCGSCGAPNCRALAEDIVKGEASENDCIIRMKEKIEKVYDSLGVLVNPTKNNQ
ncbi:MAG: 4Fe-4S dicluster domain-containing protein [Clostridia bacterium]|nr:4Fe-4S dicluster domain-containing protein [Clostridia bacterium]